MTQIDWSKAPEGATHFLPEQLSRGWVECWYKNVDGTWFGRNNCDCDWYPDHDYQEVFVPLLVERQPAWTGSGLPPVGTVCECHLPGELTNKYSWVEAKVIWHNGPTECAVIRSTSRLAWCDEFRPIRTPAQLAAEEREKAIDCIVNDYTYTVGPCTHKLARSQAERIFDAGYRKVEVKP